MGQIIHDDLYVKVLYRVRTGKKLNLKSPARFNEKINWLKINYRTPLHTLAADKYAVREYVKKIVGPEILIPLLGVYDDFDEIDFSKLPEKFILKATHGSGWNMICTDKNSFDYKKARRNFKLWIGVNFYHTSRSWEYKNIPPRIVCEELLSDMSGDLADYKIHCFSGEPVYVQVVSDRQSKTKKTTQAFFNHNWNKQEFIRGVYPMTEKDVRKPDNLELMLQTAKQLSTSFPYARVDLYSCNNKVYFGEITIHPSSGMGQFKPNKYDLEWGEKIQLDWRSSYLNSNY